MQQILPYLSRRSGSDWYVACMNQCWLCVQLCYFLHHVLCMFMFMMVIQAPVGNGRVPSDTIAQKGVTGLAANYFINIYCATARR